MSRCLNGEVSLSTLSIRGAITLVCNVAKGACFPLLVDEGYLFVEEDGVTYFLCVDKE